jgi:serine protease Do
MSSMNSNIARLRFGAAIAGAFVGGLLLASAADLTRFGWAQQEGSRPPADAVRPLAEVGSAFEAIAEHVTPAVVSIQTRRVASARQRALPRGHPPGVEELFRQFEQQLPRERAEESGGSGFIVSRDGYILTNNHVVADADRVTVTLLDKRTFSARVIGADPTTDVAVIKIDGTNLPVVSLGSDENARVGQWVVAIGNPLGLDFTVTAGIISSKGRNLPGLLQNTYAITDFIQTDAAINPGNSGGPLVNIRGEVIGVNSAIASQTGFYAGYGFAIPITLAQQVMSDLVAYGKVRRAVLGIAIDDVNAQAAQAAGLREIYGVLVQAYSPSDDSPARRAGIEPGDVIISINGKRTDRVGTLQRIVRGHKPGETVTVEAMRFGDKKTFRVRLAEAPEDRRREVTPTAPVEPTSDPDAGRKFDRLGITVEPLSAAQATQGEVAEQYRRGLMVTEVAAAGPAYRLVTTRDVVVEVLNPRPRRQVTSAAQFEQIVSPLKDGDVLTLLLYNTASKTTRVVTLPVGG